MRTPYCRRVCCCPPRRGGHGCKRGSFPRSLSCCSMTCYNRKCCSRKCCSKKCRKAHTHFHLRVCGGSRKPFFLNLGYWSCPLHSPGRRVRASWRLHVLLHLPGVGWVRKGVRWRGCGVESDGSRDLDTQGPACAHRHNHLKGRWLSCIINYLKFRFCFLRFQIFISDFIF